MHIPTLDTKMDNNCPYSRPYHFALPTDLSRYRYWHALMYLQSIHATNLTNTKWSSIPCQFWTSHIPLHLPNIIPMIWSDQYIDNLGISATSRHRHTSEYLQPRLKQRFGPINSPDITNVRFNIWYWWFFSTLQHFVLYLVCSKFNSCLRILQMKTISTQAHPCYNKPYLLVHAIMSLYFFVSYLSLVLYSLTQVVFFFKYHPESILPACLLKFFNAVSHWLLL